MEGFHSLGNSTLISISWNSHGVLAVEMKRPGVYEVTLHPVPGTSVSKIKEAVKQVAYQLLEDIERIEGM